MEQPKDKEPKEKKLTRKQRVALAAGLSILTLVLIAAGVFSYIMLHKPQSLFEPVKMQTAAPSAQITPKFDINSYLPTQKPDATPTPEATPAPEATATPDPLSQLSGIVNVALFGIDAYEDGRTTSGTMPHTDANMVLAINFDKNEVSLISLARDVMTTAPGYTGIYKFNGIFNVGGGIKNPNAGLELSCRGLEEWFGGVTVPYYYALDFQALTDLVDAIGGIDYDLEIPVRTFDNITIHPGHRHLDGKGVMAYVRMRTSVTGGLDANRTERQRKMLVAIFKKLKEENLFSRVPDIIRTMGDDIYTNTTMAQTTALVNFAKNIDPDTIKTYSIQGEMSCRYEWRYCFIDQQRRIDILKTVYGFEAQPIGMNTEIYEDFLHQGGFEAMKYLNITKRIINAAHEQMDETTMTEEQKSKYALCWKDYTDLTALFNEVGGWFEAHYQSNTLTDEEIELRDRYYERLKEQEAKLRESADALNTAFGARLVSSTKWGQSIKDWSKPGSDVNEVYVNFA